MTNNNDGIKHSTLKINGINIHIAEKGEGPVILFIHGFPELWYSWRHQILSLSSLGFRAVAPDMRGYGDSDAPIEASKYTYFHLVGDMVALIDALGVDKVFVVGHDWGAMVVWYLCLVRPDRVRALVNISVAFGVLGKWDHDRLPLEELRAYYGDDYYICRFLAPGEMETEIVEAGGAEKFLAKLYSYEKTSPWLLPKGKWFKEMPPRPTWMSEEEFGYYVTKFQQKGFTGGLNYYRAMNLNWELIGAWAGAKVEVPTKFISGDLDLVYLMPGAQDYIHKEMHKDVPLLKEVVVIEGAGHFLQEAMPEVITKHIYDFIRQF